MAAITVAAENVIDSPTLVIEVMMACLAGSRGRRRSAHTDGPGPPSCRAMPSCSLTRNTRNRP